MCEPVMASRVAALVVNEDAAAASAKPMARSIGVRRNVDAVLDEDKRELSLGHPAGKIARRAVSASLQWVIASSICDAHPTIANQGAWTSSRGRCPVAISCAASNAIPIPALPSYQPML